MAELDAHRAEVLGRSARIIQRKVLSYQSRKKFLLLQAASTDIQALCRGNTCCMQIYFIDFKKMSSDCLIPSSNCIQGKLHVFRLRRCE